MKKKFLTTEERNELHVKLFEAIRFSGGINEIVDLLDQVSDIEITDEFGRTMLHWAALCNNTALVELLLKTGAKVDIQDNAGCTPLYNATMWGHKEIVALLLKYGANPNIENNHKETALHALLDFEIRDAIEIESKDELAIAKLLVDNKAQLNQLDAKRKSPLFYAAAYDNDRVKLIELLVKNGAKISQSLLKELYLKNEDINANTIDILKSASVTDKIFEDYAVPVLGIDQINLDSSD